MKTYEPVESVAEAFSDLGKRVTMFIVCFFIGISQGFIAFLVNNLFSRAKSSESSPQAENLEWYEETPKRFLDIPQFSLVALGIIGCAATCLGMVRIIQGSNKTGDRLMTIFGSSFLSILMSQRLGWQIGVVLWIALGVFLVIDVIALGVWNKREHKKWEENLAFIREENLRKREENDNSALQKIDKSLEKDIG